MIIPFFLHPTPCYLILQWHSPCAKKTKKACLLGCTQQIVTKLKLLLKEGKKEPMHVFCSHSKPGIFTPHHLSSIFFTFQIHKASQPTHPPAWFSVRVTNVEQNESTAHMLHSSRVNSPQAQVADALSMLESVTESNIPTSCSNCRPRRTKSTTYNYYKHKGEGGRERRVNYTK